MADVLLGQAYYLRFDPKLWEAQQPYAPLGTLYAASYLRERGHARGIVRCDARRLRGRVERGDRAHASADHGDLRRQLQLPEQDVPAAHARRPRSR